MLWVRDRYHVEAAFANISDEPLEKGGQSGIDRILQDWQDAKAGHPREPTPKEAKRAYAFRIYAHQRGLLPDPDTEEARRPSVPPFPGMSREEARQIVDWVRGGGAPDEVWATELLPVWGAIVAAAEQP